ncbi:phage tail tape measure protein [Maritalea porphyrae]|uniref:phage tail tape measure protein n=1 Tax=Maritalea porphyrae TaxID=880732 RepID=UPI0022AF37A4|nr:phage tail tape measure protein [Maritalea porphyrae]MCZ4272468.1 phage tail tape measure protein [Maritalea porphyrae]
MSSNVLTATLIARMVNKISGPARDAKRSIDQLTASGHRARGGLERATAFQNIANSRRTLNRQIGGLRREMFDVVALGAAMAAPIKAAMDLENAMADVKKVVDFPTPDGLTNLRREIQELSTQIPMTATELANITAAAGQADIPYDELMQFTKMAAEVGVAFDMPAEQVGVMLSKIKSGLQLTVGETSLLSDAVNHLSNNMASEAPSILDVIRRIGGQSKEFGFAETEVSAFASAMISAGAQSDVAATSFRNMGKALTRGEAATKAQKIAYRELGLDAQQVAKDMQQDAVGTTLKVFEALREVEDHRRAALSSQLFGDEARALPTLIGNMDLLRDALGLVADESKYAGSAQREFEERANTSSAKFEQFKNKVVRLATEIGNTLLPPMNTTLEVFGKVAEGATTLTEKFPGLTQGIATAGAALIALRIGKIIKDYGWALARRTVLDTGAAFLTFGDNISLANRRATVFTRQMNRNAMRGGVDKLGGKIKGLNRVLGVAKSGILTFAGPIGLVATAALIAADAFGVFRGDFAAVDDAISKDPEGFRKYKEELFGIARAANDAGKAVTALNSTILTASIFEAEKEAAEYKGIAVDGIQDATTTALVENMGDDYSAKGKEVFGADLQAISAKIGAGNFDGSDAKGWQAKADQYFLDLQSEIEAAKAALAAEEKKNTGKMFTTANERGWSNRIEKLNQTFEQDQKVHKLLTDAVSLYSQTVSKIENERAQLDQLRRVEDGLHRTDKNPGEDGFSVPNVRPEEVVSPAPMRPADLATLDERTALHQQIAANNQQIAAMQQQLASASPPPVTVSVNAPITINNVSDAQEAARNVVNQLNQETGRAVRTSFAPQGVR